MTSEIVGGLFWDASTNASVLVVLATLTLAAVTAWMARETRRTAGAAEATAAMAPDQLMEATRARIDASGPAVALSVLPSQEGLILPQRGALPQNGGHFLLDRSGIHGSTAAEQGQEFAFPRDKDRFMWFKVMGQLHNEGPRSVRARFHSGEVALLDEGGTLGGPSYQNELVLHPGETAGFVWAEGHTLEEWADGRADHGGTPNPNRHLRLTILVEDLRRTVVDYLHAEVGGTPLDPDPQTGGWRVGEVRVAGTIYPVQRWYRHEGATLPAPPWSSSSI
jgi:hypothetical protein